MRVSLLLVLGELLEKAQWSGERQAQNKPSKESYRAAARTAVGSEWLTPGMSVFFAPAAPAAA